MLNYQRVKLINEATRFLNGKLIYTNGIDNGINGGSRCGEHLSVFYPLYNPV